MENTAVVDMENFLFGHTAGNYNPYYTRSMARAYLQKYHSEITRCAVSTIDWLKQAPADVMSMGNQTWDPESLKSIKTPKHIKEFVIYFKEMGSPLHQH